MPFLSADAAAALYWAMVEDTWAMASALCGAAGIELRLFVDEPWEGFDALAGGRPVQRQNPLDLGSRMIHCLEQSIG